MTTAARPTFEPARGGQGKGETDLSALSKQYSSRDLPSHTKLKFREPAQMPVDASREHLKRDLEERERKLSKEKRSGEKRKGEDQEDRIRTEAILSGNPLMPSLGSGGDKADFRVRRRWDDDVVFKNCAKGTMNKKTGLVFINDAIRSEFHKKFME
ncbi:unnamed protein product, partial [Darwinula stevensoni]